MKSFRDTLNKSLATALLCGALFNSVGCSPDESELELTDLTAGEHQFIDKTITVERALAVTYINREIGNSLLDSLSAAWGDSAVTEITSKLPSNPKRAIKVDELLLRLLIAEQDSFAMNPGANRLHLPLPDLNRPVPVAIPDSSALEIDETIAE
ncbi:MAG: hypothetical protein ACI9UK_002196 [Candidatus Krumholzibacteriia bacterium]|jgi:hypothetical protein